MPRADSKPLNSQRYHGIVLKDIDPLNQGRYKVWISELMHQIPDTQGIWCKNRIHKERLAKTDGPYGTYHPIRAKSRVIVTFYENDFNTGFIVERESDQEKDNLPFKAKMEDRDDIYLIQNTREHTFLMLDETKSLPSHSIHLYWNHKKHKLIFNDKGVHLYVTGSFNVTTTEDMNFNILKNFKLKVGQNIDFKVGQNINYQAGSNINLKSAAVINLDAASQNHKGNITSDYINGTITYADIAGSLGPKPTIQAGAADTAADNTGYDTKSPPEVT